MPKRSISTKGRGNAKKPQFSKKIEKEDLNFDISSDDESLSDREAANISNDEMSDESEQQKETAEETRLRIAKDYLNKIKEEEEALRSSSDEEDTDDLVERRLQSESLAKRGDAMRTFADRFTEDSFGNPTFYRGHHLSPTCLCLSHDEHTVITGSKDCDIIQWDLESGKKIATFKGKRQTFANEIELKDFKGHKGDIYSVDITFDDHLVASGGKDKFVRLFDLRERDHVQKEQFKGHTGPIYTVKFKPNSYTLYTGSEDRTIKSWNVSDMAYIETLFGHQSAVTCLDCLPDDRVVSSGYDNTIRLWKIVDETQLIYRGMTEMMSHDAITALYSNIYISGTQNGDITLWNNMKKKPINVYNDQFGEKKWVVSLASLYNSDLFVAGSYSSGINFYTMKENKYEIETIHQTQYPGFINGLCISKDARFICAAIGQEHRLGRWWRDSQTPNGILIQPLTLKEN